MLTSIPKTDGVWIFSSFYKANAVALMTVNSDNVDSKRRKIFDTVCQVLSQQSFDHLKEVYYSNGREECVMENKPSEVNLHHIETVSLML